MWSLARIAAANRAAFLAPAAPMAKVATGTPLGICAMDRRESRPLKVLVGTGTPSTGTDVLAAVIPGRCAAPPAPAMMALRPRARADAAYSNRRSGLRCAETTLTSCARPKAVGVSPAPCIVSHSDDEPMTIPTTAFIAVASQSLRQSLAQARANP